jgi:hypothetical protein
MPRYEIPVWEMCAQALEILGGHENYVPLKSIINKIHELWPKEHVNDDTIRCQILRHCINCHPSHDDFPDKGKMWRQRKLFISDKQGNYRFYREKTDYNKYSEALKEDEES